MSQRMSLSTKLIGSFVIVALITLGVGTVGYVGVVQLGDHVHEIGEVRLPSIDSLLHVESELETLRVATRTLLNPSLSAADRERQYQNIDAAREAYRGALEAFEKLPQTAEEAEQWKHFEPALQAWREANNRFMEMSRELEKADITNPSALRAEVEMFRADHYALIDRKSVV